MPARVHPGALPHGEISEVLPDVFFVTGTMGMPGPLPVRFSRNMTVVREGGRLVIVNSVRLDEAGLRALDALGKVTDVLRIAAFHGMDDPFYKERYGARVWSLKGQRYISGFDMRSEAYLEPDVHMDEHTELPLAGAKLISIAAKPPEGLLYLERQGGVLISGDALQNWQRPDQYFSFFAKPMMRMMGFIKPHAIGPAWLKQTKPPIDHLLGLLELEFEHVLPAHGIPAQLGAKANYRPSLEALRQRT